MGKLRLREPQGYIGVRGRAITWTHIFDSVACALRNTFTGFLVKPLFLFPWVGGGESCYLSRFDTFRGFPINLCLLCGCSFCHGFIACQAAGIKAQSSQNIFILSTFWLTCFCQCRGHLLMNIMEERLSDSCKMSVSCRSLVRGFLT